jgi:predicted small secreted protein
MKTLFIAAVALSAISFSACNGNTSTNDVSKAGDTVTAQVPQTPVETKSSSTPLGDVTAAYLQIKNGLANDNGNDAAAGGKAFGDALTKVDKAAMSADQKKSFEDIADDAKEMAEHISTNGGKIAHQREHFDMLSKDMYDMVKTLGAAQPLYQDFCPMYNNKKGASWLSETKDIKNPYMGKKMATCGNVKEEIKQKS